MAKHAQNPGVADLSLGGFKITNLANGVANTDAVNVQQLAAKIGGTIAAGQVAYGSGAATVEGSNNLFWDATNTRLGLGTNTPSALLELKKYNASTLRITTTASDFDQYADLVIRNQSPAAGGARIHLNTIPQPGDLADRTGIFFRDASNSDAVDFQLKYTNEGNSNASKLEFRNGSERILGFTRDKKWLLPDGGLYLDLSGGYDNLNLQSLETGDAAAQIILKNRATATGYTGIVFDATDATDFPDAGGRSRIQFRRKPNAATASKLYWAVQHRVDTDDFSINKYNPNNHSDYVKSVVLKHATGNVVLNGVTVGDVGYGMSVPCISFLTDPSAQGTYALHQTPEGNYTLLNKKITGAGYIAFRVNNVDKVVIDESGYMGIGTTAPAARLHVHGPGGTSGTYSAAFAGSDGVTTFCVRDDKRVGFFTGSPAAAVHYSLADNSVLFDASTATTSPATALRVKGKDSSFSTRFLEFTNASDVATFRAAATSTEIQLTALSRDIRITGNAKAYLIAGSSNIILHSDGQLQYSGLTSDPGTPITGAMWHRADTNRFKYYTGSVTKTIPDTEEDLKGTDALITSSTYTVTGKVRTVRLDANSNAITVTLGPDMEEGRDYLIRCTRNGTNNITFNADTGNGITLGITDDSTLNPTTLTAATYRIYLMRRFGSVVFIK